jgi:predicted metal-dependent hydrolase
MTGRRRRFHQIPRGEPRLLEGARLFNTGQFFASHEVWESLWHEVEGSEREVLQGLIQLAAAYHHLSRGNVAGARYLYLRGRTRLLPWAPWHAGLHIEGLLTQAEAHFATGKRLKASSRPPHLRTEASYGPDSGW